LVMSKSSIGIIGTGSYLPEKILSNSDLEKMVDTSDEWITKRTGISNRRILDDDMPAYKMGIAAANNALENAGVKAEEIDAIILTTNSPDYLTPSSACLIQGEIGAVNAIAFDMNAACTGFIYALEIAQSFISTGKYKKVMVISCEGMSRAIDWTDRNTCVLFGDAAGAVILSEVEEGYGILSTCLGSVGEKGKCITLPCSFSSEEDKAIRNGGEKYLWMDGTEVFKFAVGAMADASKKAIDEIGITFDDIHMVFPHQANTRIIDGAAKRMKIPEEKVYSNIAETGNISSASIPLGLDLSNKRGILKKGDNLVLVGFGGGLTWGASVIKWCL